MRNALKLEPNKAVAFSEKQYQRFLKQAKNLKELYKHAENQFYAATPLLTTYLPFVEVKVLTVEPCRIFASIESDMKPIKEALKNNKSFRKLIRLSWTMVWKFSFSIDEFEEIKKIKYPVFYVILNNSDQTIEIPA